MLLFQLFIQKLKKNVKKNYYWTLFSFHIHFLSFTFSSLSPLFLCFSIEISIWIVFFFLRFDFVSFAFRKAEIRLLMFVVYERRCDGLFRRVSNHNYLIFDFSIENVFWLKDWPRNHFKIQANLHVTCLHHHCVQNSMLCHFSTSSFPIDFE